VQTVVVENASTFAGQQLIRAIALIARRHLGPWQLRRRSHRDERPVQDRHASNAGAFHHYEKARLVGKLKAARDRKCATGVEVEGRKSLIEIDEREHGGHRSQKQQHRPYATTTAHRPSMGDAIARRDEAFPSAQSG
jgi:hypothetical protein